ncbi:MAG: hypothetical protein DWQ34_00260 [Planctomycetota bacterium]|nr:MAG: hypothetical protein DWQ29_22910 [Planctomycetota bacterium]REJ98507.1 MAG: hypothetical protein DWQ34_00260 [Planctomycetota bacterium]REK23675.1 MAG: hypothetical protein DWQ41_16465 [Planctomycetota bacterium]REK31197.1 MAG: hypothetical protein DWQ45_20065 [Planctomycetota bacterium]
MESALHFDIAAQPDFTTCGPTCLQAVYRFFGDELPLKDVIEQTARLEDGGTLAALLGNHALARGYQVTIHTYNLYVFDPTWFRDGAPPLQQKLRAQADVKQNARLQIATGAYLDFLRSGGAIRMDDLTGTLLRRYLKRGVPILTGLSSTYLYGEPREFGDPARPDDVRGDPQGHFVVLCGYDSIERAVLVADPLHPNPLAGHTRKYTIPLDRLICAIMLGIVTFDANLLAIEPKRVRGSPPAH